MNDVAINTWQDIQTEILDRINKKAWKPGEQIPHEAELAKEFGCARATVNRALRAVADSGLLERRRKAGTRVATFPIRKATFSIPIIRHEIEDRNRSYSYSLIERSVSTPPVDIRARMQLRPEMKALHVIAVHLADGKPHVYEDRWINLDAIPEILNVDLDAISANEWLIAQAPYTKADVTFSAQKADASIAERISADVGDALFVLNRITWDSGTAVTSVRLTYHPGYSLYTSI